LWSRPEKISLGEKVVKETGKDKAPSLSPVELAARRAESREFDVVMKKAQMEFQKLRTQLDQSSFEARQMVDAAKTICDVDGSSADASVTVAEAPGAAPAASSGFLLQSASKRRRTTAARRTAFWAEPRASRESAMEEQKPLQHASESERKSLLAVVESIVNVPLEKLVRQSLDKVETGLQKRAERLHKLFGAADDEGSSAGGGGGAIGAIGAAERVSNAGGAASGELKKGETVGPAAPKKVKTCVSKKEMNILNAVQVLLD